MNAAIRAILLGGGITSSDSDVTAWIAAVGPSNTTQAEVNILTTMVVAMKANGSWTLLDRLWLYALGTQAAARVDLVARASHTEVPNGGTLSWTTQKGYQPDGSNSYIDTNFNLSTASKFAQNAAAISNWIQTADTRTTAHSTAGMGDASSYVSVIGRGGAGSIFWGINNGSNVTTSANTVSQIGLFTMERSGANASAVFQNASATTTGSTQATTGGAILNRNLIVGANNNAGTPNLFSNPIIASTAIGKNGLIAASFYTDQHTGLNAINAGNFP